MQIEAGLQAQSRAEPAAVRWVSPPLYTNPEFAKAIGAAAGIQMGSYLGREEFGRLLNGLERAGRLEKLRPSKLSDYDPRKLIFETVEATKVVFPEKLLKATVPAVRELAVWVADPDNRILDRRSDDRYDFSGTFLYLVTPIYSEGIGETIYSGCSALQAISNLITGRPLLDTDWDEPLGRRSFLHPTDKLRTIGGIIVDRRQVEVLYQCRYMSDEQCFNDGKRAHRGHDLLAYPLMIRNPHELLLSEMMRDLPNRPS